MGCTRNSVDDCSSGSSRCDGDDDGERGMPLPNSGYRIEPTSFVATSCIGIWRHGRSKKRRRGQKTSKSSLRKCSGMPIKPSQHSLFLDQIKGGVVRAPQGLEAESGDVSPTPTKDKGRCGVHSFCANP